MPRIVCRSYPLSNRLLKETHQVLIISITKTSEALGLSYNAVSRAVKSLVDLGILVQTENRKRNRVFAYEEYLQALRKGT